MNPMTLLSTWLRLSPLLLASLLAVSCGAPGNATEDAGPSDPGPATSDEDALAREVLRLVNAERADAGLPALAWSDAAARVAYAHSADMQERGFFDHVNPEGEGPTQRLDRAGVGYTAAGENIAQGYPTAEAVMAAWMQSAGHRTNILRAGFTELGVGVRQGEHGPWWTQVFRTP